MSCLLAPAGAQDVPVTRFRVTDYLVTGPNPLPDAATREALADFTGEFEGVDGLLAAADALEAAMAEGGYTFHRVVLPPQTLDEGTVRLEVVVFRIGEVRIEGNDRFASTNIRRSLPPLQPGAAPNTRVLARALALANRHPAKRLRMNLKESDTADAIDAEIRVTEQRPWNAFAVLNNIGTERTGRSRLSLGVQHTNLFGRDHALTASYTTSPENTDDVEQFGFSYQIPFYGLAGRLSLFYTESDVDTGTVEQVFDVTGAGKFAGATYTQLLLRRGPYTHEWTVGVQDRFFENELVFGGVDLCTPAAGVLRSCGDVRSRPLSLGYRGTYRSTRANLRFHASYVRNLPFGDNNDRTAYLRNRARADADWDAVRLGGALDWFFPRGWVGRVSSELQYTDEPLIAGEQLGLGGASSVRGFEERNVSADSGLWSSFELWSPVAPFLENLRALAFFDIGYKDQRDPPAGTPDTDVLSSVGVGLRWHWRERVSFALDYAEVLHRAEADDPGSARVHANVLLRY